MSPFHNFLHGIGRATLGAVLIAVLSAGAFAQAAGQSPLAVSGGQAESAAPAEPVKAQKNLFAIIKDGGIVMIPLFVCSFVLLVFVFERTISLRRARVIPSPFVKRFLHQLREAKLDREQALELCHESTSAVAEVFAAAVRKWGRPSVEVEQAIIDAGERAGMGLRRYIRMFNGIATLGPLLGLLGTVFGMIRIFHEIANSAAMGRTELLAGGISEAMLATATGLSVAIPALCFYLFFVGRVERLLSEIDLLSQEVVGLISAESLQDERIAKNPRVNRRGTAA